MLLLWGLFIWKHIHKKSHYSQTQIWSKSCYLTCFCYGDCSLESIFSNPEMILLWGLFIIKNIHQKNILIPKLISGVNRDWSSESIFIKKCFYCDSKMFLHLGHRLDPVSISSILIWINLIGEMMSVLKIFLHLNRLRMFSESTVIVLSSSLFLFRQVLFSKFGKYGWVDFVLIRFDVLYTCLQILRMLLIV